MKQAAFHNTLFGTDKHSSESLSIIFTKIKCLFLFYNNTCVKDVKRVKV